MQVVICKLMVSEFVQIVVYRNVESYLEKLKAIDKINLISRLMDVV